MDRHIEASLDSVGHDEEEPSGMSAIYCKASKVLHSSHSSIMPKLASYILTGVRSPGEDIEVEPGAIFTHYDRESFTAVRKGFGISEADYVQSMSSLDGGGTQDSGKSGSLFWFSADKTIILKSITQKEVDKLLEMLPDLAAHYAEARATNRLCLLSKILGAYCITCGRTKINMMAMNNVFPADIQPAMPGEVSSQPRVYDIKGTTEDRFVEPKPGKVMKDLNFEGHTVYLPAADRQAILEAVEADTELLESYNVMDYSLLLFVFPRGQGGKPTNLSKVYSGVEAVSEDAEDEEEEPQIVPADYRMGIIDMLVPYSKRKIAAHILKKLTIGCFHEIDTEPPGYYQQRFVSNVEEKIEPN